MQRTRYTGPERRLAYVSRLHEIEREQARRRAWRGRVALLVLAALAAALIFLARPADAAPRASGDPLALVLELPTGGLPESWSFDVPRYAGRLERATVDLELDPRGVCRFENRGLALLPPWAEVIAYPDVVVIAGGALLHRERTTTYVHTKPTALAFDGAWDYDGPSGETLAGLGASFGEPTEIDPALLEGFGSVHLEVLAPADVLVRVFSATTVATSVYAGIGGRLRVTLYPAEPAP